MELVDTHCHIQSAGLDKGERITRQLWAKVPELTGNKLAVGAAKGDVTRLICVGCDLEDSRLAVSFAGDCENCWASVGIHPHEAQNHTEKTRLGQFAKLAGKPKVVAIGECGLDYYYEHSPKNDQIAVLRFQIELALEHDLPIIFHVREAFDDFWPVFDSYRGVRGVLHSFTDSAENLQKALERDLCIGINGIATFTKDPEQLDTYRQVPLQRLLLETDAPFLTPVPYRGRINQPEYTRQVAEFLAGLRGEDVEELARTTTATARRLFNI